MKQVLVGSATLIWLLCPALCQSAGAPTFEVASIKLNPNAVGRQQMERSPITLTIKKGTLSFLVQWAYNIRRDQITSPVWFKTEQYDLVAKAASPSTEDQFRVMLQNLIAERFKLEFHRETKVLAVYEMGVAKGGPKLIESKVEDSAYQRTGRSSYQIPHTTMSEFAVRLLELGAVSLPVVDRTGLSGVYDITLTFPEGSRPMDRMDVPVAADIFGIMERQLGLKLEEHKAPTEVLVIDRAERPTEN